MAELPIGQQKRMGWCGNFNAPYLLRKKKKVLWEELSGKCVERQKKETSPPNVEIWANQSQSFLIIKTLLWLGLMIQCNQFATPKNAWNWGVHIVFQMKALPCRRSSADICYTLFWRTSRWIFAGQGPCSVDERHPIGRLWHFLGLGSAFRPLLGRRL